MPWRLIAASWSHRGALHDGDWHAVDAGVGNLPLPPKSDNIDREREPLPRGDVHRADPRPFSQDDHQSIEVGEHHRPHCRAKELAVVVIRPGPTDSMSGLPARRAGASSGRRRLTPRRPSSATGPSPAAR